MKKVEKEEYEKLFKEKEQENKPFLEDKAKSAAESQAEANRKKAKEAEDTDASSKAVAKATVWMQSVTTDLTETKHGEEATKRQKGAIKQKATDEEDEEKRFNSDIRMGEMPMKEGDVSNDNGKTPMMTMGDTHEGEKCKCWRRRGEYQRV